MLAIASSDSLKVTSNTKKSHRETKKVSVDSSKKAGFHEEASGKGKMLLQRVVLPHDTGGDTSPHTISNS
eukprot:scaffold87510_cov47-Attheya_sp.AAC.6